jgi:hypothetical protein
MMTKKTPEGKVKDAVREILIEVRRLLSFPAC